MTVKYSIGVVGYSAQKFDTKEAHRLINLGLNTLIRASKLDDSEVEIVSGYTAQGIPLLAYEWAEKRDIKTVGVACARAKKYDVFPCDEVIIVGDEWGDESAAFIGRCDAILRIGGGKQSLAEIGEYRKFGRSLIEFPLEAN